MMKATRFYTWGNALLRAVLFPTALDLKIEGLERMQKWQAVANTVVFYGEHYFTSVNWTGVDRVQAGTLVHAVERAIGVQIDHAR